MGEDISKIYIWQMINIQNKKLKKSVAKNYLIKKIEIHISQKITQMANKYKKIC